MSRIELIKELITEVELSVKACMKIINKYEILEDVDRVDLFKKELVEDQAKLAMLQSKLAIELEKENQT